jgi:hypothetical protein
MDVYGKPIDKMSDLDSIEEMLTQSAVAQFPMGCTCLGSHGILGRTTNLPSREDNESSPI